MDNILELHQVCKTFPRTNFTLDHVSFSIPYGSIMGFVGENGAGKTTTIGCVLNTVSKDSGTIKIFGKELADTDTELKEKIGVVYDGDNFQHIGQQNNYLMLCRGFTQTGITTCLKNI